MNDILKRARLTTAVLLVLLAPSCQGGERQLLPPLPEAVVSFGAAAVDDSILTYGGHLGMTHEHSAENLSGALHRLSMNVDGGDEVQWRKVSQDELLQGAVLVPYAGSVLRIGGMTAFNVPEAEEEMLSVRQVVHLCPETNDWKPLPDLPDFLTGHIRVFGGAGDDCPARPHFLAPEPLSAEAGAKFAGLSNLILTPHIAGVTAPANSRVSHMTVENVLRALQDL